MKLGVFTTLLSNLPFEDALKYFTSLGIEAVEIGCGGYPGNAHANPDVLLHDEKALSDFKELIKKPRFIFSKLCTAKKYTRLETVTAFSGILELTRRNKIRAQQEKNFADIIVEKASK